MKRALTRIQDAYRCWHFADWQKVYGPPPGLLGDVSGLSGDADAQTRPPPRGARLCWWLPTWRTDKEDLTHGRTTKS